MKGEWTAKWTELSVPFPNQTSQRGIMRLTQEFSCFCSNSLLSFHHWDAIRIKYHIKYHCLARRQVCERLQAALWLLIIKAAVKFYHYSKWKRSSTFLLSLFRFQLKNSGVWVGVRKRGDAFERAAQASDGITDPGGVQEMWSCGAEGHGLVDGGNGLMVGLRGRSGLLQP